MLKAISHILLASLVLFASSGIAIDRHLCMGELQGMSLIGTSKTCHQQNQMGCANHQNTDEEGSGKGCCSNETEYLDGIDLKVTLNIQVESVFANSYIAIFERLIEVPAEVDSHKLIQFQNFHPPPLINDIPVFVQSFLI